MAPIHLEREISYESVAIVAGHIVSAIVLTIGVGWSLFRSYRALGPSQDTRERRAQRSTLVPVFAAFALASLGTAIYAFIQHAILSYKTWASQRDVVVPARFYGDKGALPLNDNATAVYLGLWLTDTPIHLDTVEVVAETARRFWWGQQIELALIPWNLLLAIEGRRRNIPLLWCYSLLGQLVSLSFAQNLFFLALLLAPSPLPPKDSGVLPVSRYIRIRDSIFPPKPRTWTPHPVFSSLTLVLAFAAIGSEPYFINTPDLKTRVLAGRGLAVAPLLLLYVVPASWGTTKTDPHEAYGAYTMLFKIASVASFALHAQATIHGLARSAPDAYFHRHSIHLPFDSERRSAWERTTSAVGRILAARADHPVVGGVAWDLMLSGTSLGLWAAVRATSVQDILASTIPGYNRHVTREPMVEPEGTPQAKTNTATTGVRAGNAADPLTSTRRGRGRTSKDGRGQTESEALYEPTPSEAVSVIEGDVLPETGDLDWESAALIWGLMALGGLGLGSAGVMGGECISR